MATMPKKPSLLRARGARRARKIPVPVVTNEQLELVHDLLSRLDVLRPLVDNLDDLLAELQSCIEVLDGSNAPEGWRAPAYEEDQRG